MYSTDCFTLRIILLAASTVPSHFIDAIPRLLGAHVLPRARSIFCSAEVGDTGRCASVYCRLTFLDLLPRSSPSLQWLSGIDLGCRILMLEMSEAFH
ncbi:hypothetical protein B0H21DRAFT_715746 [Amylocystis lapponica]|nr:hypothetical protein B0H21DRAFT_715746 [Amylocystis lapponica]